VGNTGEGMAEEVLEFLVWLYDVSCSEVNDCAFGLVCELCEEEGFIGALVLEGGARAVLAVSCV